MHANDHPCHAAMLAAADSYSATSYDLIGDVMEPC